MKTTKNNKIKLIIANVNLYKLLLFKKNVNYINWIKIEITKQNYKKKKTQNEMKKHWQIT